jgi:[ribosomal protein S18]-alanine N-acetyltransferase
MMGIKIVRSLPNHIEDIVTVENLSFRIPWSKQSITDEIIKNKFALYFSADLDNHIVGYAGMWHICDEGHITNIAVHPEFRGIGIGSLLMESLIQKASDLEIISMTLEVRKSNAAAQALYRKYGFEDGGLRKAYYADNNEDAIIMWKTL